MRYQLLYALAWTALPTVFLFSWWLETYSDSCLAEIMRGFSQLVSLPLGKLPAACSGHLRRFAAVSHSSP